MTQIAQVTSLHVSRTSVEILVEYTTLVAEVPFVKPQTIDLFANVHQDGEVILISSAINVRPFWWESSTPNGSYYYSDFSFF